MDPGADLTPPGVARLVASFLDQLGLERVTLVGNDSGGAISQLVATRHPERLGRLVLTNCDAYDNFPPRMFNYLGWAARSPLAFNLLMQTMRLPGASRLPISYGWLTMAPIDRTLLRRWVAPILTDAGVRRDAIAFVRGLDSRYTLEAAEALRSFQASTLLAWGTEDRFFPFEHAERLAAAIPNARLEPI
jgi:pimeloyl-ACP methyl ester carboxylesterase